MRIKRNDLLQPRDEKEFFQLPKYLMHHKQYQSIGALEAMVYSFMVYYAIQNEDGSFTFLKKDSEQVKMLLNLSEYFYKNIIQNLKNEKILKEDKKEFHLQNMYLPFDDFSEEVIYYG